jgi:hypothetical protein
VFTASDRRKVSSDTARTATAAVNFMAYCASLVERRLLA